VEPVVAGDKLLQPGAARRADHRGHVVKLAGQRRRRRGDVDGRVPAPAELGFRMGEQDHAQHGDLAAAAAQELLEQVGRLVELDARRAAALVADLAPIDEVAVVVELLEAPVIAFAGDGGVPVLALDRDQPRRPEQQVVDLAAPVAVPAHQHPVVAENSAEVGGHLLLAGDPGPQDLLGVAANAARRRRCRGQPSHLAYRERGAQPGEPAPLRTGLVPRAAGPPDQ